MDTIAARAVLAILALCVAGIAQAQSVAASQPAAAARLLGVGVYGSGPDDSPSRQRPLLEQLARGFAMHSWQGFVASDQRLRRWLLFPLVLGIVACGPRGVIVDIGSWPDAAQSLSVNGALNGNPFAQPLSFPSETTRFVVYISDGDSGSLSLDLAALDGNGCPRAMAATQVELASGLRRVAETFVTLAPTAAPYCPPPQVTGVTPASVVNNVPTTITIHGSGFRAGATVTVGGLSCTDVSIISASQITCATPIMRRTCSPQAVVVTNNDNQTAMSSNFAYRPVGVVFATTTTLLGAGTGQKTVVAADFNGDGEPDLATADFSSNTVSVYLNIGAGAFGPATTFGVGMGPTDLAVGDLNKDGKQDLLVANSNSSYVSFLAGNGTGGFAAAVSISGSFNGPNAVVLGDFNSDGSLDAAVANTFSKAVVILTGNGTGTLAMAGSVTVGNSPRYLATADLNNDRNLDLVTPNLSDNTISFRPGLGNATFGTGKDFNVGSFPYKTAVVDANGDQNPDILVSNQGSADVHVLLGDGAGGFAAGPGSPIGVGMSNAATTVLSIADFNGDGIPDYATANYGTSTVSIFAGKGQGGYGPLPGSPFAAPGSPFGVLGADFNGDGLIDLATANQGNGNAAVRLAVCN